MDSKDLVYGLSVSGAETIQRNRKTGYKMNQWGFQFGDQMISDLFVTQEYGDSVLNKENMRLYNGKNETILEGPYIQIVNKLNQIFKPLSILEKIKDIEDGYLEE